MIYKTAMGDAEQLDHEVNVLLSQGFELYGSPYRVGSWPHNRYIKTDRIELLDLI